MVELRVAGIEYTETLIRLWIDSFVQAYADVHSPANIRSYRDIHFTTEAAREVLTSEQTVCTLAFRNDKPVGLSIIRHHDCPAKLPGAASELKHLYILSSEYGTGLGKTLMEDAFGSVKKTGKKWMWLCVSDLNYRAQAFYKKIGFNPVGEGPVLEVGTDRLPSTFMARLVGAD